eukprot:5018202-Pyramimonas_sp.AAC.1
MSTWLPKVILAKTSPGAAMRRVANTLAFMALAAANTVKESTTTLRSSPPNRIRGEGIYPQGGPIRRGERAHTRRVHHHAAKQSTQLNEGRGHIPTGWTNPTRGEGCRGSLRKRCGGNSPDRTAN